jgi:anti-sigma factor RsiW
MNGCDPEALSRHLDGELSPEEARAVVAHMEECPACRDTRAALRRLDALCREVYPRTSFRVPAQPARRSRGSRAYLAAAAVLLLLLAGGLVYGYATGLFSQDGDSGREDSDAPLRAEDPPRFGAC